MLHCVCRLCAFVCFRVRCILTAFVQFAPVICCTTTPTHCMIEAICNSYLLFFSRTLLICTAQKLSFQQFMQWFLLIVAVVVVIAFHSCNDIICAHAIFIEWEKSVMKTSLLHHNKNARNKNNNSSSRNTV